MLIQLKSILTTRLLHPFLLISFFILYCWKQTTWFFDVSDGLMAWLAGIIIVGLGLIMFHLWMCHPVRGAIAFTFSLLLVLFYSPMYNMVKSTNRYLMVVVILALLGLLIYLKTSKKEFTTLNTYLNTLFLLLVVFEMFNVVQGYIVDRKWYQPISAELSHQELVPLQPNTDSLPDVYYILLDAYSSPTSLKKYWDYDSDELLGFLKDKGFFVANRACGNYDFTPQCMLSTFNMSYIPHYTTASKAKLKTMALYRKGIEENKTMKYFESAGYQLVNLSPFEVLDQPRKYHVIRIPDASRTWRYMAEMTLPGRVALDLLNPKPYQSNINVIEELKESCIQQSDQPKFVYAHLLLPHGPYYYNEKGELNKEGYRGKEKGLYLAQLQYTETVLRDMVNHILSHSTKPPVIVIQGDHGSRIKHPSIPVEEHYSAFYTVHLPDKDYEMFYDSISSVNTYRILFNKYFDADFEMLEDKTDYYTPLDLD